MSELGVVPVISLILLVVLILGIFAIARWDLSRSSKGTTSAVADDKDGEHQSVERRPFEKAPQYVEQSGRE